MFILLMTRFFHHQKRMKFKIADLLRNDKNVPKMLLTQWLLSDDCSIDE
jgi:hypothetical protein